MPKIELKLARFLPHDGQDIQPQLAGLERQHKENQRQAFQDAVATYEAMRAQFPPLMRFEDVDIGKSYLYTQQQFIKRSIASLTAIGYSQAEAENKVIKEVRAGRRAEYSAWDRDFFIMMLEIHDLQTQAQRGLTDEMYYLLILAHEWGHDAMPQIQTNDPAEAARAMVINVEDFNTVVMRNMIASPYILYEFMEQFGVSQEQIHAIIELDTSVSPEEALRELLFEDTAAVVEQLGRTMAEYQAYVAELTPSYSIRQRGVHVRVGEQMIGVVGNNSTELADELVAEIYPMFILFQIFLERTPKLKKQKPALQMKAFLQSQLLRDFMISDDVLALEVVRIAQAFGDFEKMWGVMAEAMDHQQDFYTELSGTEEKALQQIVLVSRAREIVKVALGMLENADFKLLAGLRILEGYGYNNAVLLARQFIEIGQVDQALMVIGKALQTEGRFDGTVEISVLQQLREMLLNPPAEAETDEVAEVAHEAEMHDEANVSATEAIEARVLTAALGSADARDQMVARNEGLVEPPVLELLRSGLAGSAGNSPIELIDEAIRIYTKFREFKRSKAKY